MDKKSGLSVVARLASKIIWVVLSFNPLVFCGQGETTSDAKVIRYESMQYPTRAQADMDNGQGLVIIQAVLDKQGRVVNAEALSGSEILVPDTIANIKKWRFESNASNSAIVIYDFRVVEGRCKSASSFFQPDRNFVSVIACSPNASGTSVPRKQANSPQNDNGPEVTEYEEMRYPPFGVIMDLTGVVVLRAKLNDGGNVVDAKVMSGNQTLAGDCVSNLKKWKFKPNHQSEAFVAYRFILACETSANCGDQTRQFVLEPPNLAIVKDTRFLSAP